MKKFLFPILTVCLLTTIFSCSEDFKVAAPYKDITVIYGLLDIRDTAHYIRIQKAFMDEDQSAVDMAKVADSSFYNALDVKIKEFSGSNLVGSAITLNRVDLNKEGYSKDPGNFFTTPSWAYKFKAALHSSNTYRLVVTNTATGMVDSSEINILDTTGFTIANISLGTYRLNFAKTIPLSTKISFFGAAPKNTTYVEAALRFHWTDKNIQTGAETDKYADFRLTAAETPLKTLNTNFSGVNQTIYSFLANTILAAPDHIERYLDSCDLYVYAGGKDLYNYTIVSNTQSGGLTADQVKPIFTNISGKDVYGLFSSRTSFYKFNIPIDSTTLDSLMVNPITAPLNIRGFSNH